jgi:uncharacterized phosphosugar-binding protein
LGTTGGMSTALAILLVNAVLSQVIQSFVELGEVPPIIRCPNVGSEEQALAANAETLRRYRGRLPHL